jgi:hypothetical protein
MSEPSSYAAQRAARREAWFAAQQEDWAVLLEQCDGTEERQMCAEMILIPHGATMGSQS